MAGVAFVIPLFCSYAMPYHFTGMHSSHTPPPGSPANKLFGAPRNIILYYVCFLCNANFYCVWSSYCTLSSTAQFYCGILSCHTTFLNLLPPLSSIALLIIFWCRFITDADKDLSEEQVQRILSRVKPAMKKWLNASDLLPFLKRHHVLTNSELSLLNSSTLAQREQVDIRQLICLQSHTLWSQGFT